MTQELWTAVDTYLTHTIVLPDDALDAAVKASDDAGLPSIQVSAPQGKLLHILARMQNARRILEIGTLGGYSTIWMASALPKNGKLITIEIDAKHAEVAGKNFERASVADRIELVNGNAIEVLPTLAARNDAPFDMTFIDADKASIPAYFDWAMQMSRPGSIILVDNVVREGAVIDAASQDAAVMGVRRLNDMMAADSRVTATVIQTVGVKGYDGLAIAFVNSIT